MKTKWSIENTCDFPENRPFCVSMGYGLRELDGRYVSLNQFTNVVRGRDLEGVKTLAPYGIDFCGTGKFPTPDSTSHTLYLRGNREHEVYVLCAINPDGAEMSIAHVEPEMN